MSNKNEPIIPEVVEESTEIASSKAISVTQKALSSSDPLVLYLNEIRKYALLTKEQELELATKYYETKDPEAAEKLVTANLRFVVSIANEYSQFGAKLIDLIQEGNVGLMHAVREFNPYKGVRLITYAVWWIRGYIRDFLLRQYSLVRLGTTTEQKKLFYQLQKEKRRLESLGQEIDIKQLSSRLGSSEEAIAEMEQRIYAKDVSLDQPLDEDFKESMLERNSLVDQTLVVDDLEKREQILILQEQIEKIKPGLNEKEIYILENRLLSDDPITLQEVGNKFQISRERARQIEASVLKKIKSNFVTED